MKNKVYHARHSSREFGEYEEAEQYAKENGGGHIYPLFNYTEGDFYLVNYDGGDGKVERIKHELRKGAQKKYDGFLVTLFKDYPRRKEA